MTLQEIDRELQKMPMQGLLAKLGDYASDERAGVQKLVRKYRKKYDDYVRELERLDGMMLYERKYADYGIICGIDEAGRGPLAGPVVAAAVILPVGIQLPGVNDSKKITEKKREQLFDFVKENAIAWGIGQASETEIDEINILQATFAAMRRAADALQIPADFALVDGNRLPPLDIPAEYVIGGDGCVLSIAAASILAKVTRDRYMREMALQYPEYGFEKHKGYGTKAHYAAIAAHGICPLHRKTFLKKVLER
ncbi:MAG TPA: ribonuclease HII [Clostridiales bacterium]|nr:ribonuclease HII [Clostridiales bacterium]